MFRNIYNNLYEITQSTRAGVTIDFIEKSVWGGSERVAFRIQIVMHFGEVHILLKKVPFSKCVKFKKRSSLGKKTQLIF